MVGRDVLIVEDDARFSVLIEGMLRSAAFSVRCASGGLSALALAAERSPDVAVVDLGLPDCDGTDVVRQLAALGVHILVMTGARTSAEVVGSIRAGAAGFLFKEDLVRRLIPAIDDLLEGGAPLSTAATKALMAEVRGQAGIRRASAPPPAGGERLTAREREVLAALARGLTYDQVGMALDVSGNTVRTHVRKIYQKLGAATRTEAVLAAIERGVLRPMSSSSSLARRSPAL